MTMFSSVQFSRSVVSDSATPWTMTMLLLLALGSELGHPERHLPGPSVLRGSQIALLSEKTSPPTLQSWVPLCWWPWSGPGLPTWRPPLTSPGILQASGLPEPLDTSLCPDWGRGCPGQPPLQPQPPHPETQAEPPSSLRPFQFP